MSDTLEISCPSCDAGLKIPPQVLGKKIKCKHCGHTFLVQDPAAKPGPKATAKPAAKPAAAPPPEPKKNRFQDDDDDDGPPKPMVVVQESDVPRCPHCAQELDPPDAEVCLNCGFNNKTRVKANTRKVWAPDAMDWIRHLAPGVGALAIAIGLVVLDIFCIQNMTDWLTGTFLETEEKGIDGKNEFFVRPGAFSTLITVSSIFVIVPMGRYAVRRLVLNYKPEERVKK